MAENTQDSYPRCARKFIAFCDKPAQDVDELDARRYAVSPARDETRQQQHQRGQRRNLLSFRRDVEPHGELPVGNATFR